MYHKLAAILAAVTLTSTAHAVEPVDPALTGLPTIEQLPAGTVRISPFVPRMGEHWADPKNVPPGPVWCVIAGRVVCIEYMISQADLAAGAAVTGLKWPLREGKLPPVDHVDANLVAHGHPGYEVPHYDFHSYFVSKEVLARYEKPTRSDVAAQIRGLADKCLSVMNGSPANGTALVLWPCEGGANQRWSLAADGGVVGLAGKCLSVMNGSPANGTALVLWPCEGGANQRWSLAADGGVVGLAGKCVSVMNGSPANGTALVLWPCEGGANQRWSLN